MNPDRTNPKFYHKVVRAEPQRKTQTLRSILSTPCCALVVYRQKVETWPREDCGPLCVFSTREQALAFTADLRRIPAEMQIWTCLITPSGSDYIWLPPNRYRTLPLSAMPAGTVLADSVTLWDLECALSTPSWTFAQTTAKPDECNADFNGCAR